MPFTRSTLRIYAAFSVAMAGLTAAHGGGSHQKPIEVDPDADWATRHMAASSPPCLGIHKGSTALQAKQHSPLFVHAIPITTTLQPQPQTIFIIFTRTILSVLAALPFSKPYSRMAVVAPSRWARWRLSSSDVRISRFSRRPACRLPALTVQLRALQPQIHTRGTTDYGLRASDFEVAGGSIAAALGEM
ncbi:hypothetical protein B7463_g10143, partial [Scytalidium lignicola]